MRIGGNNRPRGWVAVLPNKIAGNDARAEDDRTFRE